MKTFSKPLFVFEMANNHQGDIEHGKNIIRAMRQASAPFVDRFDFAVKFQYRDLTASSIRPSRTGWTSRTSSAFRIHG